MSRQIFRKEALERLASPEQLDQLMQLTGPRSWLALGALGLLLLLALLWGIFGTIATTVDGQGVLLRRGGVTTVEAPAAGVVTGLLVHTGDRVKKGQELLRLAPEGSGSPAVSPVSSPFAGRVLEWATHRGDRVKKGAGLVVLEPLDEHLEAVLYVPVGVGYRVRPGMEVQLTPANVRKNEFGYLLGRVKSAAKFPATRTGLVRRLQNDELANSLAGAGPSLEVVVELVPDRATKSGYEWSSARGTGVELYSGTPCRGLITVGEQRPIQLLLPALDSGGP